MYSVTFVHVNKIVFSQIGANVWKSTICRATLKEGRFAGLGYLRVDDEDVYTRLDFGVPNG